MQDKQFIAIRDRLTIYERLMRLDKPIGILLLLWPTLWAIWIASNGHPSVAILVIFTIGTVLMRSAGCVLNDIADREFDKHVERTRDRPLATGAVSVKEALILAGILALLAFLLVLPLNWVCVALTVPALLLAATYPYTKRFLAIPQAYLGVAFGFGIPMGFAAESGTVPALAWLLLLANVFWAMAYDTEYAMVDRDDDVKIGIRTSAITLGRYDVLFVMLNYAAMLYVLAWIGIDLEFGLFYFVGLVVAVQIAFYHYTLIRKRERAACFKAFMHNNWLGAAIFAGIAADHAKYIYGF
jgi:4-hydroxybenzoate polyprenyltransferase